MEPPPATAPYADSLDSSPRSRNAADAWEVDPLPRLRLMCSYGGHIVPRPHDKSLCYIGGDTKIVVVDRNVSLSELSNILARRLLNGRSFTLKYQLPSEDLDSLISVTTDDDLDSMIEEFERMPAARVRLFLFPTRPDSSQSMDLMPAKSEDWFLDALNGGAAMLNRGFSNSASVDCLLGFDGGGGASNSEPRGGGGGDLEAAANGKNVKAEVQPDFAMMENSSSFGSASSLANLPPIRVHVDDVSNRAAAQQDQKAAGIEEQFAQMTTVGMAGQQKQDDVSGGGGFAVLSSPPPLPTTIMPPSSAAVNSSAPQQIDYMNRVVSDDERSDHGGYRKAIPPQTQPQPKSAGIYDLPSPDSVSSDHSFSNVAVSRPKPVIYSEPVAQIAPVTPTRFPGNLVDPKVNLSDANGVPRFPGNPDRVQMQQQLQDSAYVLQNQYGQQLQQQQQLLQQQVQHQQQQFIHPGAHYVQQHHPSSVPVPSYYPVYPSQQHQPQQQQHQPQHQPQQQQHQPQQQQHQPQQQQHQPQQQQHQPQQQQHQPQQQQHQPQQQQLHHRHPQLDQQQQYQQVYYMPARQAPPYNNLHMQQSLQSNMSEATATAATITSSPSQAPANPMLSPTAAYSQVRNAPIAKPEIAAGMYRTTTAAAAAPSLIQVPTSQHQPQQQYVSYAQVHPSQAAVPNSTGAANYAYEYADASHAQHAQIYYTQPLPHAAMTSQYQTMTAAAAMGLPDVSAQLPSDNIKQQQQRSK